MVRNSPQAAEHQEQPALVPAHDGVGEAGHQRALVADQVDSGDVNAYTVGWLDPGGFAVEIPGGNHDRRGITPSERT